MSSRQLLDKHARRIAQTMMVGVALSLPAAAAAQGNADAGKKLWAGNTLFCENCHGPEG